MKIRTAIVGYGHLGKIHARLMATLPQFETAVVVDPLESSRTAAAETLGVPTTADYREWIDRVDAVVLASPTKYHCAAACDFLAAGKHVFVEKPLAATTAEGEAIVAAARRTGAMLQVGHVERFNPAWEALTARVAKPTFIEARREGMFSFRSTDIGVVLDLMIHDLDLIASLVTAPLVDVEAGGTALLGRHEDTAFARLRFADGCTALVHASRAATTAVRQLRLQTETAFAAVDFQTRAVQVTQIGAPLRDGSIDVERMTPAERTALKDRLTAELLTTEKFEAEPRDAITAELCDFAAAIATGRSPRVSGDDGLTALRWAERIVAAIGAAKRPFHTEPRIVRPPHWQLRGDAAVPRREAG